ncbi:hypothetical protein AGDE_12456 [Angomonas deanei]|uniref:BRCT domain-containing protein n=1 Tax=Angomonas deanei TaxID=59799 RepID=A0A7G2C9L6_9TRYP|nr:hypothetical protein AGDE_12456 [Angomonas deanei]CAD2216540.1 hypothetical protein, conserved [Angomonas deanei]|eukprot:EPY24221.1 hypothetical protein AGDE_12456 [Angomonas deanei]
MCQICSVDHPEEATYCPLCLYSRPMSRHGVPQIFAGFCIHFNGIIPRTLIHPSHSVEWRMAERHGAVCLPKFDPRQVNLLIYRMGYERSEKCRACLEKYTHVHVVPITWMLDSLLQSRQIHPMLYRLTSIPAVAQPTVKGTNLPHHQHPYFQINKDDYAIPTSFPQKKGGEQPLKAIKGISMKAGEVPPDMADKLPPFFDIDPLQYTNVDVFEAALKCGAAKGKAAAADDDNDEIEERRKGAGIELLASQSALNKVDKMLLSGITAALSPALQKNDKIIKTLEMCGAKVLKVDGSVEDALKNEATHVLYAHEDKKSDMMIVAAHLVATDLPGLQLAQSNWVEDSLILGELLPLYGMYVPTPKLMETLNKKYNKKS